MLVTCSLTVGTRRSHKFGDLIIIGREGSSFSIGAEVLGRIEAEGGSIAQGTHAASPVTSAVSLCRVLQNRKVIARGDDANRFHVGGAAVKMNGKDGARSGCNRPFKRLRIE